MTALSSSEMIFDNLVVILEEDNLVVILEEDNQVVKLPGDR